MPRARVLSGVQPTGSLHLGNWLGAIRNWVDLQDSHDTFFCVVDLHAITVPHNPAQLAADTRSTAALYLACGIDPAKATVFVQSHVSAHSELCWLLNCVTPLNWLERMIQFKEKAVKQGDQVSVGLLDYPVLMAADILAYDATTVPVGDDQVQHVEVCRDLAGTFNHLYGDVFTLPKARVLGTAARVPGTDGQKMSKSYDNTIQVFEEPAKVKKKIMRITTDSRPMEDPKDPETDHLFELYRLMASPEETASMAETYRRGGFGYGEIKKALHAAAEQFFADARGRRAELAADPATIAGILDDGAARAREQAQQVLDRARAACGLSRRAGARS